MSRFLQEVIAADQGDGGVAPSGPVATTYNTGGSYGMHPGYHSYHSAGPMSSEQYYNAQTSSTGAGQCAGGGCFAGFMLPERRASSQGTVTRQGLFPDVDLS